MYKTPLIHHGSIRITKLILRGSLYVSLIITSILIGYDIYLEEIRIRTIIGLTVISYLVFCVILLALHYFRVVNWLLLVVYSSLAIVTLLFLGLNATAGLVITGFVIILAGILLGSRVIIPVSIIMSFLLLAVQTIHSVNVITPDLSPLNENSTYLDVISYISILGVFALVTWLSNSQTEKSIQRAKKAEAAVRAQKESISNVLEKESAKLRATQLKELQQLYKFATLGQSAAATLHELSNHLSVLNMDIDDLKQQHRNSRAIANAKEGIEQINLMVRQVRRKLNSYDDSKLFKIGPILRRAINDLTEKSNSTSVELVYQSNSYSTIKIPGDPLAFTQIITVLVTNALDACAGLSHAKVLVNLEANDKELAISVLDNGIGVNELAMNTLFLPTLSSKPTGMGVGLYIAQHLAKSHFRGAIHLEKNTASHKSGAHFKVTIPLN